MTSLITGAGLVGTAYAQAALSQGDSAVFFDVRPDAAYLRAKLGDAPYATAQGDLRDLPALVSAMQEHRPDIVVHTAGLIGNSVGSPVYTGMQINVQGTINVLEAARLTGVKRFVHVSTYGVYDRRSEAGTAITEDYPRAGEGNPYSASKVANEHIAQAYATYYGFELAFVRPANVFGYGHFRGGSGGGMTVHSVVEAGFTGEPLVVPAIRGRAFEYVYCKDLGRLVRRAATVPAIGRGGVQRRQRVRHDVRGTLRGGARGAAGPQRDRGDARPSDSERDDAARHFALEGDARLVAGVLDSRGVRRLRRGDARRRGPVGRLFVIPAKAGDSPGVSARVRGRPASISSVVGASARRWPWRLSRATVTSSTAERACSGANIQNEVPAEKSVAATPATGGDMTAPSSPAVRRIACNCARAWRGTKS